MPVIFAVAVYAAAMIAANLSVAAFGPWVSPINSFLLIGLDLTLRDRLHDAWSGRKGFWINMGGLILVSALISYAINPASGQIAFASFAAFVLAGIADAVAYHFLRKNHRTTDYLIRTNGSNVAGAAVDSVVFPTLAFGVFMPEIVGLQFLAKVGGGFAWSILLKRLAIA